MMTTMTTSTIYDSVKPDTDILCDDVPDKALGDFIADYASWLWGCGATCIRIEKNVSRIAACYGYTVDINVMPRHITLTFMRDGWERAHIVSRPIVHCGINFDLNTSLSALSWDIRDNGLTLEQSIARFHKIIGRRYDNGFKILVLASLANAAFCRLFGGDAAAMAIVCLSTAGGYLMKQLLIKYKVDIRVVFFICALVSTILCAGATMFGISHTPEIAIATCVLYLIPGVPYLNSASDLIGKHYLCAYSRLMDALVLTACLSAGMCLGLFIMNMNIV